MVSSHPVGASHLPRIASKAPPLNVAYWEDVFVLVDSGRAPQGHYVKAGALVREHAAKYPTGVGILTIVPGDAVPPPEPVRKTMNEVLRSIEPSIRCFTWLVEGHGFQGAMVRAVCNGMRIFGGHPYPTHVASGVADSLSWMLPHLENGHARLARVREAVRTLAELRASGQYARSF